MYEVTLTVTVVKYSYWVPKTRVLVNVVVGAVIVLVGVTVVVTAPDVTVGNKMKMRVTPVLQKACVGYVAGIVVTWPEIGVYVPVSTQFESQ